MWAAINKLTGMIGYGLLLVLPPPLLIRMTGFPLSITAPDREQFFAWLRQPLTFATIETLFVLAGWLMWALYVAAIAVQVYAWTTKRLRLPRLAVPKPVQAMTAAVLGATAAAAATGNATPAAATPPGTSAPTEHPQAARPAGDNSPTTVARDSPTAAGGTSRGAPRGPLAVYTVAEADRLWTIADRFLGDPRSYVHIADLNPELERADRRFPDHIEPGQHVRLPASAHDRGRRPHAMGKATPAKPADRPAPPPRPEVTPAPAPNSSPPTPPPPTTTTPPPEPANPGNPSRLAGLLPAAAVLSTGGVLTALLLYQLTHRRRDRPRPRRHTPRQPAPHADPPIRATTPTIDVDRLNRALRALATGLHSRQTADLPDIAAAWLASGAIDLVLASPDRLSPAPFHTDATGLTWSLPPHTTIAPGEGVAAPLPLLAAVGSNTDGQILIDLERAGVLAINGDRTVGVDLLRYLAAELATNQWSDHMRIVLAGFDPEYVKHLAALNDSRITTADSVAAAIADARDRAATNATALAHDGSSSAFAARLDDPNSAHDRTPHVFLIADAAGHEDDLRDLDQELTHAGRCAVAIAAVTTAATTWRARVAADGAIDIDWLAVVDLRPNQLAPEQLAAMAALVDQARADQPAVESPAASEAAVHSASPQPPASDVPASPTRWGQVQPGVISAPVRHGRQPDTAGASAAAASVSPPDRSRSATPSAIRSPRAQPADDAELDADLNAWHADDTRRPRIAVLGPVQVRACGEPPDERLRFYAEIVVYIAQRGQRGATGEQIQENIWPDQDVSPRTRRVALSKIRRWLGRDEQGEPWLPHNLGHDRVYRLRPGTLTDWDLFHRLHTRAQTRGGGAADDLRHALQLVRGEPLAGVADAYPSGQRIPYRWLPQSVIQPYNLASIIVDTAHQIAELSLARGDTVTARWAVERAWTADPARSHDHTWIDAIRTAHLEGRQAELRVLLTDLIQTREVEVLEDLAPNTYAAIEPLASETLWPK